MEETVKKYEFRELTAQDIFPMFAILNKIGFKKFKDCFDMENISEMNVEAVGMTVLLEIAGIIIENLPDCEEDIYSLLSKVSTIKKQDIRTMPAVDFAEMIVEFIKKPEFKDFLKVVSKLFK